MVYTPKTDCLRMGSWSVSFCASILRKFMAIFGWSLMISIISEVFIKQASISCMAIAVVLYFKPGCSKEDAPGIPPGLMMSMILLCSCKSRFIIATCPVLIQKAPLIISFSTYRFSTPLIFTFFLLIHLSFARVQNTDW